MSVCLGYDNTKYQDGSGAQAQRIFSVRALARYLGMGFYPAKVLDIDFNPGDGIDDTQKKVSFLKELNSFLEFENACDHTFVESRKIPNHRVTNSILGLRLWSFLVRILSRINGNHLHISVANPERWISRNPEILRFLDLPKAAEREIQDDGPIIVTLHIQRAKNTRFQLSDRYVPTEWYRRILDTVCDTLKASGMGYQIELHTDASEKPKSWNLGNEVSQKTRDYWQRGGFLDQAGVAQLGYEDFFSTLDQTSDKMKILRDLDPISAWHNMAKSQILITGKSSFSYIGALLTHHALIITPDYFNRGPSNWVIIRDEIRESDLAKIRSRIPKCIQ